MLRALAEAPQRSAQSWDPTAGQAASLLVFALCTSFGGVSRIQNPCLPRVKKSSGQAGSCWAVWQCLGQ